MSNLPSDKERRWPLPLPVVEIGHLFPNYRPRRTTRPNESSTVNGDAVLSVSKKRPAETDSSKDKNSAKRQKNSGESSEKKGVAEYSRAHCGKSKYVTWKQRFEELKAYKAKYGSCNVPHSKKAATHKRLGDWVHNQRSGYNLFMKAKEAAGNPTSSCLGMTIERIGHLEEIGFEWSVGSTKIPWDTRFEELKEYKEKYGTCNVPFRGKDGLHKQLGHWVNTQRNGYKMFLRAKEAGEPTTSCYGMTEERIGCLEEIGFEWSASEEINIRLNGPFDIRFIDESVAKV